MEISNDLGYRYIISELISEKYYDKKYDSEGNVIFKTGPYIVYKVIPITEKTEPSINIRETTAPVQVVTGGGNVIQHNENSKFSNLVKEYKNLMIDNGILEEDINIVIQNPDNEDVRKSFLSKYGLELVKISINVAGIITNLLKLFQNQ